MRCARLRISMMAFGATGAQQRQHHDKGIALPAEILPTGGHLFTRRPANAARCSRHQQCQVTYPQ